MDAEEHAAHQLMCTLNDHVGHHKICDNYYWDEYEEPEPKEPTKFTNGEFELELEWGWNEDIPPFFAVHLTFCSLCDVILEREEITNSMNDGNSLANHEHAQDDPWWKQDYPRIKWPSNVTTPYLVTGTPPGRNHFYSKVNVPPPVVGSQSLAETQFELFKRTKLKAFQQALHDDMNEEIERIVDKMETKRHSRMDGS